MSWKDKSWKEAAREYHAQRGGSRTVIEIEPERLRRLRRLLGDDASLERAWHELNSTGGRAAQATVEALMFSLRSGVQALGRHDTIRRLSELSDQQLRDVAVRLQRFKPHIAPAWNAEEIAVLIAVRSKALAENS
jgi:uncharacterized protein YjiS (DUF1127 family)